MQTTPKRTRIQNKSTITPAIDVYESNEAYLLVGDLPGVSSEQLEVKVERGILSLDTTGADPTWDYHREFRLSDDIDPDAIMAKLDAGVLELRLGKRSELRPRKIEVRPA